MNMFQVVYLRHLIRKNDLKRNRQIPEPEVNSWRNLRYEKGFGKYHLLDVFTPLNAQRALPVLVVVHGGGWMYGDKEIYHLYAKDLARRGFAVISYNYPLAPQSKFPSHLERLDCVLLWAKEHAKEYGFDLTSLFLVGDSAGAQMSAQYAAAMNNSELGKLLSLQFPLKICGLGLNCGVYRDLGTPFEQTSENALWPLYLGKHYDVHDPRYGLLRYLTPDFPPCYVMTCEKDFVKTENKPLVAALAKNHINYVFKEYTSKEGNKLQHVFHCTVNEEHAIQANDDECAFFKQIIAKKHTS